jgi:acetyl-CoA carboxylase biotin carboxyl carrier protein
MTLDELKQILEMVREHELAEFEFEHEGVKLRLRKHAAGAPVLAPSPGPAIAVAVPANGVTSPLAGPAAAPMPAASAEPGPDTDEDGVELAVITSPIVGTFYRSPSPEASPFVDVGSRVKQGQPLCIIEAMKLMNEIESEYDGEIVRIFVESGQPVQYGERLFAVKR